VAASKNLDPKIETRFQDIVGAEHVLVGDGIPADLHGDECLSATPTRPLAVVRPGSSEEVAALLGVASSESIPVTARGSGTGLAGGCVPRPDGIVVCFSRMNRILEIDRENFVAVVEPGVQLDQLEAELAPLGLVYPVFPGENSASLGGNVNTNAGGTRAVKYGVTRHHVLGVEAVLATGEVIECGGKRIKTSSGYDLTQLIIGSEGTLALVTRAVLKLQPRPALSTTVLAPFASLDEVTRAVPQVVASGIGPLLLEYIDLSTMALMVAQLKLELGIPDDIRTRALAYLVVCLESNHEARLEEDTLQLGEQLAELGALDVYVLPPAAGGELIAAREKAFWLAKGAGADDILDVVVPRAAMPEFMKTVEQIAAETGTRVPGCGHAGDGNVHMAVFQPDPEIRARVLRRVFEAGLALGGAISGEHGLGKTKRKYFLELEDPAKLALMRRIKAAFDPTGILNPDTIF